MASRAGTSASSSSAPSEKVYNQRVILTDDNVKILAREFFETRPCLRKKSSLLRRLPWNCSAICEAEKLEDWVLEKGGESLDANDGLLVSTQ